VIVRPSPVAYDSAGKRGLKTDAADHAAHRDPFPAQAGNGSGSAAKKPVPELHARAGSTRCGCSTPSHSSRRRDEAGSARAAFRLGIGRPRKFLTKCSPSRCSGEAVAIDPIDGVLGRAVAMAKIHLRRGVEATPASRCDSGGPAREVAYARSGIGQPSGPGGAEGLRAAGCAKGDRVRTGTPLLKFDLDLLARKAASLITPIVITNGERFPRRR